MLKGLRTSPARETFEYRFPGYEERWPSRLAGDERRERSHSLYNPENLFQVGMITVVKQGTLPKLCSLNCAAPRAHLMGNTEAVPRSGVAGWSTPWASRSETQLQPCVFLCGRQLTANKLSFQEPQPLCPVLPRVLIRSAKAFFLKARTALGTDPFDDVVRSRLRKSKARTAARAASCSSPSRPVKISLIPIAVPKESRKARTYTGAL